VARDRRFINTSKNWEQLRSTKRGTVLYEQWLDEETVFLVVRGTICLCAYLGIPQKHPLGGLDEDVISEILDVRGGITFQGEGSKIVEHFEDFFFYGWGYAESLFDPHIFSSLKKYREKQWLTHNVIQDCQEAIRSFMQHKKEVENSWNP